MPIRFDATRWDQIRETYTRWVAGEVDRPIIHLTLTGCDADGPPPEDDLAIGQASHYELADDPHRLLDRVEYRLCRERYLGDAYPHYWPNFGPGVLAAFCGATPHVATGTTWFQPPRALQPHEIALQFGPANPTLARVEAMMAAAVERFGGLVQIGMTDLGGNLDILSTFRPGEQLLLDLYDCPSDVERVTWQVHEAWFEAFDRLNAILRPGAVNPGFSAWAGIYSPAPSYMLQCDFCYMISPEMFDRFVKPELKASCDRLGGCAWYHLDGPGQLPHLDSLLTIESLRGVQWVPGSGNRPFTQWPEVYRKIQAAGKLMQIWGRPEELDVFVEQLGSGRGIFYVTSVDVSQKDQALALLDRYGVPQADSGD